MSNKTDPKKFAFNPLSDTDNLTPLDFTEDDGSDPLEVNKFIHEKATAYYTNKLAAIWTVRYQNELAGSFSLSMFAIEIKHLAEGEKVEGATPRSYPAVLLGQMGVDKKYRRRGFGYWVCQFCIGLAQEISKSIACRYIVLHTDTNEKRLSFYQKIGFIPQKEPEPEGKILMYMRLS